jgi:phage tail sheath protein FI
MPPYLSPGVYVEETDSGARPIEAVGTSTAGFVGVAPRSDVAIGEAVAINNWSQFVRQFVPADLKPEDAAKLAGNDLANAVQGFFLNGGSRCYVAPIAPKAAALKGKGTGLDALGLIDEIAIIAAPGRTDIGAYNDLVESAQILGDRVAVLDAPPTASDVEQLTRVATLPDDGAAGGAKNKGLRPPDNDKGFGAYYFPWLRVRDAIDPSQIVAAPPSGHIAGLYARTDAERGVHKAPANIVVRGALGLTQLVSTAEQAVLNPAGVNCIRLFTREGIRVWGARTIAPAANNWRYLNVRRLFNMIEESIAISTRWVVFEPNDRPLWKAIQRDVSAFLTLLWRQGALAGSRPEQAFFVKCDEETNPPDVIDAGQVVVMIGIAPVKPAEFVIFRIGQTQSGTTVETA